MSSRYVKLYLQDMLDSIDAIFDYTKDIDFENFKQDRKTYQAVIKEFEIIGEAAKKIPDQIIWLWVAGLARCITLGILALCFGFLW